MLLQKKSSHLAFREIGPKAAVIYHAACPTEGMSASSICLSSSSFLSLEPCHCRRHPPIKSGIGPAKVSSRASMGPDGHLRNGAAENKLGRWFQLWSLISFAEQFAQAVR